MRSLYTLEIEWAVTLAAETAAQRFLDRCTTGVVYNIRDDAVERGESLIASACNAELAKRGQPVMV